MRTLFQSPATHHSCATYLPKVSHSRIQVPEEGWSLFHKQHNQSGVYAFVLMDESVMCNEFAFEFSVLMAWHGVFCVVLCCVVL